MTSPDAPASYRVGDDVETIVPPRDMEIHPLNALEERAAREDPNAFHIPRAAWESFKKVTDSYTTITPEQFQKSTNLPDNMARAIFLGMQARGAIDREADKGGGYIVRRPEGEAAYRPLRPTERRGRLARALFEVARQGAEVLHARGIHHRTYDNNRAGQVGAMPGENNQQLWGVVITDSPLNSPNYFNPELNPQDELRRSIQPRRREGRVGRAATPHPDEVRRSSRATSDKADAADTSSRKSRSHSTASGDLRRGSAAAPNRQNRTLTAAEQYQRDLDNYNELLKRIAELRKDPTYGTLVNDPNALDALHKDIQQEAWPLYEARLQELNDEIKAANAFVSDDNKQPLYSSVADMPPAEKQKIVHPIDVRKTTEFLNAHLPAGTTVPNDVLRTFTGARLLAAGKLHKPVQKHS